MKKAILISLVALATQASAVQGETTYNVLLAGGPEINSIRIWLTPDGESYVIDSIGPLEVGGTVCENPAGNQNELVCQAPQVSAFEVNADGSNDQVRVSSAITIPVTLRGGTGGDVLIGGSGADRLLGGDGGDRLIGRDGNDVLIGGDGSDDIYGGNGNDVLLGGAGTDILTGGPGENTEHPNRNLASHH